MRTIVTILLITLCLNVLASETKLCNNACQARRAQALVATGGVSGGAKASGSVSGGANVSGGVKVTVPKVTVPKIKVTVPKVTVPKIKIGGSISGGAKASGSTKTSTSGSAKGGVSGGAKIHIGIPSIKIGGSLTGGATGSSSTKTVKKAVVITGSCPQAVNMGLTVATNSVNPGLGICKFLKNSCCDAKSTNAVLGTWKSNMRKLGKEFWLSTRISTAAVVLLSNLSTEAETCKATPAPKRRLRKLQAIVAKPKASIKVTVPKVTVPKIKIGGSVSGGAKASGSSSSSY